MSKLESASILIKILQKTLTEKIDIRLYLQRPLKAYNKITNEIKTRVVSE